MCQVETFLHALQLQQLHQLPYAPKMTPCWDSSLPNLRPTQPFCICSPLKYKLVSRLRYELNHSQLPKSDCVLFNYHCAIGQMINATALVYVHVDVTCPCCISDAMCIVVATTCDTRRRRNSVGSFQALNYPHFWDKRKQCFCHLVVIMSQSSEPAPAIGSSLKSRDFVLLAAGAVGGALLAFAAQALFK